jgi:hypothetical protein
MFKRCQNPLCNNELTPGARKSKKFCCDRCRLDAWILAKAAKLLFRLEPREWHRILEATGVKP